MTTKNEILNLCQNTGMSIRAIAARVGCSKRYVEDVAALAGRYRLSSESGGDDEKHILLIAASNKGMGFPVCVKAPLAA